MSTDKPEGFPIPDHLQPVVEELIEKSKAGLIVGFNKDGWIYTEKGILTMPAGLEMDALVAEKVMGWKFVKPRHGTCCTCQRCGRDYDSCGGGCEYSGDIAAAWTVVEKMKTLYWELTLQYGSANSEAMAKFWRTFVPGYYVATGTVPAAICRAALIAMLEKP
jgi:hypothetical protein